MEPSIFTRIINNEVPSHKVYEDNHTLAFMNILPSVPGHVLVVPKVQVERVQDLDDDLYVALMSTVKKVMKREAEIFGPDYRICLKVMGFDVPHAHIHVLPCKNVDDFQKLEEMNANPDHAALAEMAKKLSFN